MRHLLLPCLLLLTGAAQAQTTFSIGPKVGANLANFRKDASSGDTDYRFGVAAGIQATLGWGKFALQTALLFSQKGNSYSEELPYSTGGPSTFPVPGTYTRKLRLDYLTLPLNFTFAPAGTGTGPQFFAGPYLSVLLGGRLTQSYPPDQMTTSRPVYVVGNGDVPTGSEYYANRFDAGLQAGVGFRFEHLLLQAEYSLGLRDQYPAYINTFVANPTEYNRSFQASVSYLFDLGR